MSTSILLPEGYRYVAAALVSAVWLIGWQTTVVYQHRKKSGISYPQLYAEKAEAQASREAHLFNCAQRAHQNTLEHMPIILITTLVSGVKHPVLAASACAFWVFTRVLYTIGYTTGDAAKRNRLGGILGEVPFLGLIFGSTFVVYQLFVGA
ncbi:membrane-associated proteins in eicosanoid and glutathione metabolism [Imleria badia]|nr:membrane-associated proteins in eicosanoid and glutathione metabolism [Imleria badia]